MLQFLTEENLEIHKEFIRQKKLKLSILEKSIDGIKNKNISEISRQKLNREDKREALELLSEITLHEIFFSSFGNKKYPQSHLVSTGFGSEAAFLNAVYRACLELNFGFVVIYSKSERIVIESTERELYRLLLHSDPILAVDVSEHSYFLDYGFDKERYLTYALPYLDLTKLNNR